MLIVIKKKQKQFSSKLMNSHFQYPDLYSINNKNMHEMSVKHRNSETLTF